MLISRTSPTVSPLVQSYLAATDTIAAMRLDVGTLELVGTQPLQLDRDSGSFFTRVRFAY